MKIKCIKDFHFKCVYFGQSVSGNSVFWTTFIRKCTVKIMVSHNPSLKVRVDLQ